MENDLLMDGEGSGYDRSITGLLNRWAARPEAADTAVFELVYDRLHEIAVAHLGRQGGQGILQATAVLNEAFLRLARSPGISWNDREHFFACCSRVMRHVLVDFAKECRRLKRGSEFIHVALEETLLADPGDSADDVVAVHQALGALEAVDPERARVVELRYFGGLSPLEIARVLDLSESTVHRRWRLARAWLFDFLKSSEVAARAGFPEPVTTARS